jgi:hypothetical protein
VGLNLASQSAGEDPGYPDRASLETDSGKAGERSVVGAKANDWLAVVSRQIELSNPRVTQQVAKVVAGECWFTQEFAAACDVTSSAC